MNDKFEQLIEATRNIVLAPEEKVRIHTALLSHMRKSRMQKDVRVPLPYRWAWWRFALHPMPIALMLVVIVGSSASYAAHDSLPGDTLYPVKTGINEEVLGWFAVSDEARLTYEKDIAERRLEEAEQLAFEDRFDAEAQTELAVRFGAQARRVDEEIEKLEDERVVEESSDFEARLNAHSAILEQLYLASREKTASSTAREEKSELAVEVKTRVEAIAERRVAAEAKVKLKGEDRSKLIAERKLASARKKIEDVRLLALALPHEEKTEEIGVPETDTNLQMMIVTSAESRMSARTLATFEDAEQIFTEAEKKMEARAYGEAFVLFQKAERIAEEVRLLIRARKNFNIEVHMDKVPAEEDNTEDGQDSGVSATSTPAIQSEGDDKKQDDVVDSNDDAHAGTQSSSTTGSGINTRDSIEVKIPGL